MPLVTLNEILPAARNEARAVAAFNVANLETLLAVFKAAEEENSPVIIQVYQRLFNDERAELIAAMTAKLAEKTAIQIVLHLDHGTSVEQIKKAIKIGYTSVMIDGSQFPLTENIELTSQAVEIAHKAGVSIEAEIGHVPFGNGKVELSSSEEAVKFVSHTNVDALAISIGTAHGFYKEAPCLDIKRAREIGAGVSIPLVLHGGTGVPEEQLKKAIAYGVTKINLATELQDLFLRGAACELKRNEKKFMPIDLCFKPVEKRIIEYSKIKIKAFRQATFSS
ncbi:MAG: class II fructose-bisphosphate aldolase [Victivallaceae bacterium]|nr:class II fructose-bisphosphate aldolase [Victivallaceae bacterium]